jgi:hypothetical protein
VLAPRANAHCALLHAGEDPDRACHGVRCAPCRWAA